MALPPLPMADPTPAPLARAVRITLILLLFAFVAILTVCDLNSYDTWTHLATGRLMWEEKRIPDHEPYSYSQNCEMSLEEASPQYTVRYDVLDPKTDRVIVSAGVPYDKERKAQIQKAMAKAGIPLSELRVRIEPPLRMLLENARASDGRLVLPTGTVLHEEEIETLRAAGIERVITTVPWVNHEWLFQIPAYLSYKYFGMPGPTIFKCIILVAAYLIVFFAVYRKETHVFAIVAVFLAAIVSYKRFYMRPEILSILFTAAWFFIIERFRRKPTWWICFWLPALMVLWINSHGYFILGVAVPLLYLLLEGLQAVMPMPRFCTRTLLWKNDLIHGKALGIFAIATGLTIAATLANPYGVAGARYPLDVLGQVSDPTSVIRTVIGEMQPPFQFSFTYAVFFSWGLLALGIASWLINIRRFKFSRFAIWLVAFFFMTKALRNMPFFGVPGAIFLALNLNESWAETRAFLVERVVPGALWAAKWLAQAAVACGLVYFFLLNVSDRFYVRDIASIRCGFGYSEDKFSMGAAEWVKDHPVKGPLFNAFGMGGLCMWKLYPEERRDGDGVTRLHYDGRRLFIDGRAEMYGGPFVKNYTLALSEPSVWKQFDDKYRFGVVFLNWQAGDTQPLMHLLYTDPGWALVYGDGVGYVFVRNVPENRAVIDAARRALESPRFVDFTESYASILRGIPWMPSMKKFGEFQGRVQAIARVINGDPRLGDEARRTGATPGVIPFDRRFMSNRYDHVREWLPFLPERQIAPGELMGTAGFALLGDRPDLAEAVYLGLVEHIAPDVPELLINLAQTCQARAGNYFRMKDNKKGSAYIDNALLYFRRAEKIMPNYPGLSIQLLRLYDAMGDHAAAMSCLRTAASGGLNVSTATLIASVYLSQGYDRTAEALGLYRYCLTQMPPRDQGPIMERIAFCLIRLERPEEALRYAYRAVDLESWTAISSPGQQAQDWYTLGLALFRTGRREEAVGCFQQCRVLDPDFKPAVDALNQIASPPPQPNTQPPPSIPGMN